MYIYTCCTHPCNDIDRFTHSINHQISKERICEGQEQKSCRNYNINFIDKIFVIGFCQITLDLFTTPYNNHIT